MNTSFGKNSGGKNSGGKNSGAANQNKDQLSSNGAAWPEELAKEKLDSAGSTQYGSGPSDSTIGGYDSEHGSGHRSGKKMLMKLIPRLPRLPRVSFASMYRTVTLSVEKDLIRVAVFKGNKIISWGTTPLNWTPGELEAANHPEPEKEKPPLHGLMDELGIRTGGRLRGLLDQAGIRRGRVVMDFSLYTTLMRRLQVPKVTGRYLEPMIISEVLDAIPFERKEVDIAWHLTKGQDEQSVFAITLPKDRVDSQVRLIRDSGLYPAAAYSKATVLALAAGIPNAIVVHLEQTQTAIVLVSDGDPQVVHQLDFAEASSGPEEQGEAIARAVDQVAGYHQSFDPRVQNAKLPVILTGENSADSNPVVQNLKQSLNWEIRAFKPPVDCPEGFPIEQYATNVGLLLADRAQSQKPGPQKPGNEREQKAPALDLLPKRHRPIPLPTFQAAIFVTLFLLALHPFDLTDWIQKQELQMQVVSRELRDLQQQEKKHDVTLVDHQQIQSGYDLAREQTEEMRALMAEMGESVDTLLTRLVIITDKAKPDSVSLIAVSPSGKDLTIMGGAKSYGEALRYSANLRTYSVFEDARTVQIQGSGAREDGEDSLVSFRIKVILPAEEEAEE